jgi:excisionase family DNA binding protein
MRSVSQPSRRRMDEQEDIESPTFKVSLDPETIDAIAAAVAERCNSPEVESDRWMTSAEAAAYLAIPYSTFRKLTAAGRIVGEQDTVGGRFYFRRSYLDSWRSHPPE